VRTIIGVAREEGRARERKERAEQRRLEIAAKKAELQRQLEAATAAVGASSKAVEEAEATLHGLPEEVEKALNASSAEAGRVLGCASELHARVDKSSEAVAAARQQLAAARTGVLALCEQGEKAEEDEGELKELLRSEAKPLSGRCDVLGSHLDRVEEKAAQLRQLAGKKELADLDRCRAALRVELRKHAQKASQTLDELFAAVDKDGDGAVSEADLLALLSSDGEAVPEAVDSERLGRLFSELAEGDSKSINKDEFKTLTQAYYKVCKQTVLTSMLSIKDGKTVLRIEAGEVLVAEEEPQEEEKTKVMRVRCKVVKDGTEGYVSICGNQGTQFLEEGGDIFKVLQPVDLTPGLAQAAEVAPVRGLREGELLQVIKWEQKEPTSDVLRMKARARSDGAVGWVTMANADGVSHLKMA